MDKNFIVEFSETGRVPCLWEQGGGYSNTGDAIILTDSTGNAGIPQSLYIRRKGDLACKKHALIPIDLNTFVVEASHHRGDFDISIYWIYRIENGVATGELVQKFSQNQWGEWDDHIGLVARNNILAAVDAAKQKAMDYHCRVPYWVKES